MLRKLNRKWIIAAIIFLAVSIRFYKINMPLLEGCVARQIFCADVSRNMYRDGEFLKPKLSLLPEPRLYLGECPIYCSLVSIVYKIIGDVKEVWGRIITIISFVVGMILLYLIVREFSDEKIALISMSVFSLLPVGIIYGKSFQPDQLSVTFGLLAIYLIMLWTKKDKLLYFFISIACLIIGSLTKLTTLSILLTALAIVVLRKEKRSLPYFIVYSVLVITGISPWLLYIYNHKNLVIAAYTDAFSFSKWLSFERLLSYGYYKEMFLLLSGVVLTPIGFSLFLLGLILKNRKKEECIFYIWLISAFLPFVFLNKKFGTHWFLLPLPVLSYFVGKAVCNMKTVLDSVSSNKYYRCIFTVAVVIYLWGYINCGFIYPHTVKNTLSISKIVKEKTEFEDLICTDAGVDLLYYSDRKGYSIWRDEKGNIKEKDIDTMFISEIERLKREGVDYLIISRIDEYKSRPFLKEYIENNCELVEKKDICLIYKL